MLLSLAFAHKQTRSLENGFTTFFPETVIHIIGGDQNSRDLSVSVIIRFIIWMNYEVRE